MVVKKTANKIGIDLSLVANKLVYVNSFENEKTSRYFSLLSNVFFIYSQRIIKTTIFFSLFSIRVLIKTIRKGKFSVLLSEKILESDWMHQNLVQTDSFAIRRLYK